jgi:MurNAc alpha-1-phosphate uridylyltransferase
VAGKPLIVWHIEALARDGVTDIVVNTAWLEEQIVAALGDGSRWGVRIRYSMEARDHGGALETAGGIATAEPWMGSRESGRADADHCDCYWLVSADIYCPGFKFDAGVARHFARGADLAHVWLVPNPPFHPDGDFAIDASGRAARTTSPGEPRLTYANLALCRSTLTGGVQPGQRAPLGPLLFAAADSGRVGASLLTGSWHNVGTPSQLARLNGG